MPQLGETVTEGTITKWYKAVGDSVARDEPLFEVSTDKVDSEVPSPAGGVITAILVEEGDTVDVGATLAVIGDDGAPAPAAPASAASAASAASDATPAVAPDASAPAPMAPPTPTAEPLDEAPAPAVQRPPAVTAITTALPDEPALAPETGAPRRPGEPPVAPTVTATTSQTPTSPPVGPPSDADKPATTRTSPTTPTFPATSAASAVSAATGGPGGGGPVRSGNGIVLSPVVRKLLDRYDLDASAIAGTGLGGRITRADVEALIAAGAPGGSAPSTEPSPVPSISGRPATDVPPPTREGAAETQRAVDRRTGEASAAADEVLPFTNIRRRTAEHMIRSKATSAHTLMVKEIDYESVERVRRAYGERFREEEGFPLTYLPFVGRATVEALVDYPHLNASVGEDALIVHRQVNLGIAVDLDNQGLIVPVVHGSEELNLKGMARRIRDVADRARTKRLSLDDISGGTFSITNAGPFGTLITGAIINQPQVAILSTDGVSRRPVVVTSPDGTESIGIHSVGLVAMNFDHRAVDGAYVARFLARLSEILSDRDWSVEL